MSPAWIEVLRAECGRSGQKKTANRLGVSAAQVNQVLKGAYKGNPAKLEQRVRGELMRETVRCPVLGEINTRRCLDEQVRPLSLGNRIQVRVYRACRGGCPNYREKS